MKRIAAARTPGEWPNYQKVLPDKYGAYCPTLPPSDCDFIAMAANNWDKLMAVAEAAKSYVSVMCDGPVEDAGPCWERLSKSVKALEEE